MEILSGLVVLGMVSFVFWVMWRGVSNSRSGGLAPKKAKGALVAGLVGLVSALAVAQLAVGADGLGAVSFGIVGFGVGVTAALLTVSDELAGIVEWGFSLFGVVATLPALVVLVQGSDCPGGDIVPVGVRLLTAVLLVLCLIAGVVSRAAVGKVERLSGLAWFGAVEVLSFLQTPAGVDLFSLGAWRIVLVLVVAGLVGFAAAWMPGLVIGAAGISIALSQFVVIDAGLGCGVPAGSGLAAATVVFVPYTVAFVGMRLLVGRFRR